MEALSGSSSSSDMCDFSNISGTDRFSSLPDSILLEILSFLDMKQVGMASLVSRRCRYLWRFVPRLNFDHRHWKRNKEGDNNPGFVKMVDHVLEQRYQNASSMQELRLSCHSYCSPGKINNWVMNAAAIGHIKKLSLKFACYNSKEFKFPDILFTSKVEAFNLVATRSIVGLPDSMSFSSRLKTLHLKYAKLPQADPNGKLVLSCPILESLSLISCCLEQIKILNISAPQLKNLLVQNDYWNSSSCNLEIHTPELISLHFEDKLYEEYTLGNLCSLVNAKIESSHGEINEETLISIMEGIRHATNVELSCRSVKANGMVAELFNTYTPIRSLRLVGWSKVFSATMFQNLLRWSPRIESLSLGMNLVQTVGDWGEVFVFIRHLKFVEIQEIKGCPEELKFFKFLFENAVALREFTAVSAYRGKNIIKFSKKIHSLPKASSSLSIVFVEKR